MGWQFRTWIVFDKLQAGAGTHRGSIDSAGAPNVTAPVESVLVFYRGSWYRSGPAAMPHDAWLSCAGRAGCGASTAPRTPSAPCHSEELPLRCITLFSFLPLLPFAQAAPAGLASFRLGVLFLTFLKIGAQLYGSGYVLLAFLRDDFVNRLAWLTDQQLLHAVAVAQFTPGPVFTTATLLAIWWGAGQALWWLRLPSSCPGSCSW